MPAVPDSTTGSADRQPPTVEEPAAAVPHLGGLVDDLVKGREDVVGELHLRDGRGARSSGADPEADDALFGQRGVEDAARAEARGQARGAAEDSPKGDVFAKDQSAVSFFFFF